MPTELIRRMRRVPFFSQLSTDALRLLSFSAETQILRAHDVLFDEGTPTQGGYLILDGTIVMEANGKPVSRLEPGTLIGETAMLTQTYAPATAIAATACTLLRMPRTLFLRVLNEFPEDAAVLLADFAARTQNLSADLSALHMHYAREPK